MKIQCYSDELQQARQNLLQVCLRPHFHEYPLEAEYPLVLHPDMARFSFCVCEDAKTEGLPQTPQQPCKNDRVAPKLIAHANLWPRVLYDESSEKAYPVAFVGNVATAAEYQGQGVMRALLDHVWEQAQGLGLQALVLWSELVPFYRKLGFQTCGIEKRLYFSRQTLQSLHLPYRFRPLAPEEATAELLAQLLKLRFATAVGLQRSVTEFRELLTIPDTTLLVSSTPQASKPFFDSYAIVGKGCDLIGHVHEWGASCPQQLLAVLRHIVVQTAWPDVGLLVPASLPASWSAALAPYIMRQETQHLALIKERPPFVIKGLLERGFIWGLDSI